MIDYGGLRPREIAVCQASAKRREERWYKFKQRLGLEDGQKARVPSEALRGPLRPARFAKIEGPPQPVFVSQIGKKKKRKSNLLRVVRGSRRGEARRGQARVLVSAAARCTGSVRDASRRAIPCQPSEHHSLFGGGSLPIQICVLIIIAITITNTKRFTVGILKTLLLLVSPLCIRLSLVVSHISFTFRSHSSLSRPRDPTSFNPTPLHLAHRLHPAAFDPFHCHRSTLPPPLPRRSHSFAQNRRPTNPPCPRFVTFGRSNL